MLRPRTLLAAAALAPLAAILGMTVGGTAMSAGPMPDLVELQPGGFDYRASGAYTREGKPAQAPLLAAAIDRPLGIMRRQVTEADYRRCVDAGACPVIAGSADAADRPMVKVNWRDAESYAAWLSRETGTPFRLPTDIEWAYAAGSRVTDDGVPDLGDGSDPGRRELALYDREAGRDDGIDPAPQPVGSFGTNENGLLDIAGNVWEWTESCFVRSRFDGPPESGTTNCGVRVVEGRHRAYVPDFIRDARGGGCAVGRPPSNLGFRLVRDDDPWRTVKAALGRAERLAGL